MPFVRQEGLLQVIGERAAFIPESLPNSADFNAYSHLPALLVHTVSYVRPLRDLRQGSDKL